MCVCSAVFGYGATSAVKSKEKFKQWLYGDVIITFCPFCLVTHFAHSISFFTPALLVSFKIVVFLSTFAGLVLVCRCTVA